MSHVAGDFVERTLFDRWRADQRPVQIREQDWRAGLALLTEIALDHIAQCSHQKSESDDNSILLNEDPQTPEVDKIRSFVQGKEYIFKRACKGGIPFSLLEHATVKEIFKTSQFPFSFLSQFIRIMNAHWMSEEELDKNFSIILQFIQLSEISNACADFIYAYIKNQDNKSGYYFLWLLKQVDGCSYNLPERDSFGSATVTEVLSQFVLSGSSANLKCFAEILMRPIFTFAKTRGSPICVHILDQKSNAVFLNFVLSLLQRSDKDTWPSTSWIFIDFFKLCPRETLITVASFLETSMDDKTAKIGTTLSAALAAGTLQESLAHVHVLKELLPKLDQASVEEIFGIPYFEFRKKNAKEPLTKRLNFDARRVFVYRSLMIGTYGRNEKNALLSCSV